MYACAAHMQVSLSYLEIYNEHVRDLLQPSAAMLELREETRGPHAGVTVAGLTRLAATSTEEVMSLLQVRAVRGVCRAVNCPRSTAHQRPTNVAGLVCVRFVVEPVTCSYVALPEHCPLGIVPCVLVTVPSEDAVQDALVNPPPSLAPLSVT